MIKKEAHNSGIYIFQILSWEDNKNQLQSNKDKASYEALTPMLHMFTNCFLPRVNVTKITYTNPLTMYSSERAIVI